MRAALIRQLNNAGDGYVSGGELASKLGVSRNAIWKHVEALRELGYMIDAVPRRGYRITQRPDRLFSWEISSRLTTKRLGHRFEYHEQIGSTNERAKQLAVAGCGEGQVVVAEEQVAGKGRLGRSWVSPFGQGLFVSVVLRPSIMPAEAPKLTLVAAVAVQRAIAEACGVQTQIKWPNDLEIDGKKVCGILVELGTEVDAVDHVVVGIGINANLQLDELPGDVQQRATSLRAVLGHSVDRVKLLVSLLDYLERLYDQAITHGFETAIELTRRLSSTLGRYVRVIHPHGNWEGTAVDIAPSGGLIVRTAMGDREVHSGEVSIRPV